MNMKIEIDGLQLVMTSVAFPEQYDVLQNGEVIGYLRMRSGIFTARVPDASGLVVYATDDLNGFGSFVDDAERSLQLSKAVAEIKKTLEKSPEVRYMRTPMSYLEQDVTYVHSWS